MATGVGGSSRPLSSAPPVPAFLPASRYLQRCRRPQSSPQPPRWAPPSLRHMPTPTPQTPAPPAPDPDGDPATRDGATASAHCRRQEHGDASSLTRSRGQTPERAQPKDVGAVCSCLPPRPQWLVRRAAPIPSSNPPHFSASPRLEGQLRGQPWNTSRYPPWVVSGGSKIDLRVTGNEPFFRSEYDPISMGHSKSLQEVNPGSGPRASSRTSDMEGQATPLPPPAARTLSPRSRRNRREPTAGFAAVLINWRYMVTKGTSVGGFGMASPQR